MQGEAPAPSTLLRATGVLDQARAKKPHRYGERELRDGTETWMRARWPGARICHELVLSSGDIRLDIAAVLPDRLIIVELKSFGDSMHRALHQVGMACLCGDEAWIVTDKRHLADSQLLEYLLPGIGVATGADIPGTRQRFSGLGDQLVETHRECARTVPPHPRAMLSLLWVAELRDVAHRHRVAAGSRSTHPYLVNALESLLTPVEVRRAVCAQLRARDALWRADPPIPIHATSSADAANRPAPAAGVTGGRDDG